MTHVSGRAIEFYRHAALWKSLAPDAFFRQLPFNADSAPKWIDWSDFVRLCRGLRSAYPSDGEIEELGTRILEVGSVSPIIGVLRLGIQPRTLYWASHNWGGPALFPSLGHDFQELSDGRLHLGISIPHADEDCPELLLLIGGMFRALPRQIGLPEAIVDTHVTQRRASYLITPPPNRNLFYRIRRAAQVLFSGETAREDPTLASFNQLALQQTELKAAWRQAVEALEVRRQFLASVSHELRTPLHGILGLSELVQETPLSREQRALLASVQSSAESLLDIINQLLDFSRIEAGHLQLDPIDTDLADVIEAAVEVVAKRAQAKGLELAVLLDPRVPPSVRLDPGRLRQVLINLLDNAVKFTAQGQIVVEVTAPRDVPRGEVPRGEVPRGEGPGAEPPGQLRLRFEVRDTGIGLAREHVAAVFQPFAQADTSTSRRFGGTGLGLAICRQIVERMGGEISLEPRETGGTTAWFTIEVQTPAGDGAVGLRFDATDPPLRGRQVLLAEPRPATRQHLARQLRELGLAVTDVPALPPPPLDGYDVVLATEDPGLGRPGFVRLVPQPAEGALAPPVRRATLALVLRGVLDPAEAARLPVAPPLPKIQGERRPRILVAEDNPVNQRVAAGMLDHLGCDVVVVDHGGAAVEAVAAGGVDLVLMDCQMPEVDGYEATRRIRALPGPAARVPVVAMTAHVLAGERELCQAAGMDDYLPKPVGRVQLGEALRKWLPDGAGRLGEAPQQARFELLERELGQKISQQLAALMCRELESLPRMIAEAGRRAQGQEVARLAHRLKGGCTELGLQPLCDLCDRLIEAGRSGVQEGMDDLLNRLEGAAALALADLRPLAQATSDRPAPGL